MNILVLGHKGMLGHMVKKYFTDCGFSVETTDYRFPSEEFKLEVSNFSGDFIVNCVGSIPQKTNDFFINYELPIWLSENCKCNIVHAGTDCEMDPDDYGISKLKARDYIIKNSKNTKIIKCSLIGPELKDKKSLLEWFINSNQEVVFGWSNAYWNGITTLEWSKNCKNIMLNWDHYAKENIIEGTCISKYDLLLLISEVYGLDKKIQKNDSVKINRCLKGNMFAPNIKDQLIELKNYYV